MATKSMLKTITIKNRNMGKSLADALEKSIEIKEPRIEYKRKCTEIKKGSVKKFFDNY